ncbi:PREDICTED: uncharacterized protein LOC108568485 [Nicrophorus vespilloides]|uniref:Uncharacterized protein LOC108568485 n=1 Tax=Nicrophorus vespilloides TaxID=110193 RepID=A0ABM1NE44_NICVS|nr:PREDICTED: uncharacterized protein LOC108568485 [Nicrophorus vespilloides]
MEDLDGNYTTPGSADYSILLDVANGTYADLSYLDVNTLILLTYLGNVAFGALMNSLAFLAILRNKKRNGTLSVILQISAADVASTCVCFLEIWSLRSDTWRFPSELCPMFSGFEVLLNTLTLYLIITLNFHTISLCNLKVERKTRNPLTSCESSNECLVRDSRNTSESRKQEVSVIIPCVLVWFICISLSIPQFTLSSVMTLKGNYSICTVADAYYNVILQESLMLFRVFIPLCLLAISTLLVAWKSYEFSRKNTFQNIFMKKADNVLYYLIFCLFLNSTYILTSVQRLALTSMHTLNSASGDVLDTYKMPPLFNNVVDYWNIWSTMLHYSGTFFRFIIYVLLLPKFKALFCNKILMCFTVKQ